jgi:hypothetical protein
MATTTQSIENVEAGEDTLGLNSLIGRANTDSLPIVEITASDPEASEAGLDTATFTVTRSGGDLSQPLRVFYSFTGSAAAGSDFQRLPSPIIIPANATSVDVVVTPVDDDVVESLERLNLFLSDGTNYDLGASNTATVTIADDDSLPPPSPIISIAPPTLSVEEGDSGSFTVLRTGNTTESLQVSISLNPDADLTVDDFSLTGNILAASDTQIQLIIPAGETSTALNFTATSDGFAEAVESLELTVTDTAAYDVSPTAGSAIASIAESAAVVPTVSLTPDSRLVNEGESTSFTVTRTGDTDGNLFVNIRLTPDAGLTTDDFSFGGNVLVVTDSLIRVTIPDGQASSNLVFTAETDALAEPQESLGLRIINVDAYDVDATANSAIASIAPSDAIIPTGSITIVHDTDVADGTDFDFAGDLGSFTLDDATPDDGDAFGTQLVFDEVPVGTYTIQALPEGGFDLVAIDVTAADGSSNLPAGSATVTVAEDEAVVITFISQQVVPENIDYAIAATVAEVAEGNAGTTPISFTLTRSGTTTGSSSVEFLLAGGAGLGEDYSFEPATGVTGTGITVTETGGVFTVTFAPNATDATLTLNVTGDTVIESNETVQVQLQNGTAPNGSATISTPDAATTILNDDEPLLPQDIDYAVATDTDSLSEGNVGSQTISFTISRTGAIDVASQVELALGGSAGLGTDYEFIGITGATLLGDPLNPTIAFAADETTATLTFSVVGDTVIEPDETLVATLSNGTAPGNATISVPSATTTILTDDTDEPPLPDAGPLLDLSDEVGPTAVVFEITREAALDNVIQFYEIDDNQGTVAGLAPGDEGYAEVALSRLVPGVEVVGTDGTTLSQTVTLEGGKLYAPVLFTHGDPGRPLFSFNEANPGDRIQVRSPEPNLFLFEDLVGGDDDFDDLIIQATVVSSEASDDATATSLMASTSFLLDGLDLDLSQLPSIGELPTVDEALSTLDIDELTGLATVGAELLQQALTETGVDGILYFYEMDAFGQVDGVSPLDLTYEDAVLNNIISQVALSDFFVQPLPELPSEPNYGVAVALSTEPDNLYTVQDLLTLDASIPDLGGVLV